MKDKRVCFFTSGAVGGAERVTLTIAKLLPTEKFDVQIVHICKNIRNLDKFVPSFIDQSHIRISNIWDFTTLKLFRYLKKNKPDIVFCSLHYLNVRLIIAARLVGINKIIVRNNIGWTRWPQITKILARKSYPKASVIILQTKEMEEEFKNAIPEANGLTVSIPNPIDIETIDAKLRLDENPFSGIVRHNFVFAGRIDRLKGLDVLLKAFKIVLDKLPDSFLTIVGAYSEKDEYYNSLINIIEELKLNDAVEFVGFSDNPYKYIQYADCLILPSRMEGNPNVLHEAMYLKTPVVATESIPIIPKIVTRDRGITVAVDDWEGMADAMIAASHMKISKPYDITRNNALFVELFK